MSSTPKPSSSSSSSSNPSWNWLPPRPTAREMAGQAAEAAAAPVARPCLPAIEPLDDRILLSAAAPPTAGLKITDGTSNTAVLIGLLKGGLDMIKGEVSALKLAVGGEDSQIKGESTLKLLTDTFLKLDETLFKLGDAVMVGDVNGYKEQTIKLDAVLHKVDELAPSALPAVQRAADALIKNLTSLEGGQKISPQGIKLLTGIGDGFLKIDEALLKYGADPTGAQFKQGLNPAIKIDQEFIKIGALLEQLDPQIKGELTEALNAIKVGTLDYLGSLVKPVDNGGLSSDGPFGGGVTLPDDTGGDVLA
jgi:hypothetical protein